MTWEPGYRSAILPETLALNERPGRSRVDGASGVRPVPPQPCNRRFQIAQTADTTWVPNIAGTSTRSDVFRDSVKYK
jgi:hypothetical protein